MKYRRNKVKREHSIIQGALPWLEELTKHPEVTDIIPGVIEANRSPERGIVYKYETQTGCKLLLKSHGSIQEAFVVTKDPAWVKAWVAAHFPPSSIEGKEPESLRPSRSSRPIGKNPKMRASAKERAVSSPKNRPKRKKNSPSGRFQGEEWAAGSMEPPSLGEQINPQMRKALRQLQSKLEGKRR